MASKYPNTKPKTDIQQFPSLSDHGQIMKSIRFKSVNSVSDVIIPPGKYQYMIRLKYYCNFGQRINRNFFSDNGIVIVKCGLFFEKTFQYHIKDVIKDEGLIEFPIVFDSRKFQTIKVFIVDHGVEVDIGTVCRFNLMENFNISTPSEPSSDLQELSIVSDGFKIMKSIEFSNQNNVSNLVVPQGKYQYIVKLKCKYRGIGSVRMCRDLFSENGILKIEVYMYGHHKTYYYKLKDVINDQNIIEFPVNVNIHPEVDSGNIKAWIIDHATEISIGWLCNFKVMKDCQISQPVFLPTAKPKDTKEVSTQTDPIVNGYGLPTYENFEHLSYPSNESNYSYQPESRRTLI